MKALKEKVELFVGDKAGVELTEEVAWILSTQEKFEECGFSRMESVVMTLCYVTHRHLEEIEDELYEMRSERMTPDSV